MAKAVFKKPLDKRLSDALYTIVDECARHDDCYTCPFADDGTCNIARGDLPRGWYWNIDSEKSLSDDTKGESVQEKIKNASYGGSRPVFGDLTDIIKSLRDILNAYFRVEGSIETVHNLMYSMGAENERLAIQQSGITDEDLKIFGEIIIDKLQTVYRHMVCNAIMDNERLMDILVNAAVGEDDELIAQKGD